MNSILLATLLALGSTTPCFDTTTRKYDVTEQGIACIYTVVGDNIVVTAHDCGSGPHDVWIHSYGYVLTQNSTLSTTPVYFGDFHYYNVAGASHTFAWPSCGWYREVRVFISIYEAGTENLLRSNWIKLSVGTPPTE